MYLRFTTENEDGQTIVHEYGSHDEFANEYFESDTTDIEDEVIEASLDGEEIDLADEDIYTVEDLQFFCKSVE